MNIWHAVHREAMAAWRSMRYDMRQSSSQGPRTETLPPVAADPDQDHPEYEAYARRTRRMRRALAVAALSVGGAAATYFGVVGGLTALVAGEADRPGALPGVTAERPPGTASVDAGSRASQPDANAPSMLAPSATGPAGVAGSATPVAPGEPRPIQPGRSPRPTGTNTPPVPTPAPHPTPTCGCPRPTPTPTGSPSPTPSPAPAPDPSEPPEPPEWAVAPAS